MDWTTAHSIFSIAATTLGLVGAIAWRMFAIRGKDLGKVYRRLDQLTKRVNSLSQRQTILETKMNNGISEEIAKLRTTRHEHANAIQTLRSEVEHIKDMLK